MGNEIRVGLVYRHGALINVLAWETLEGVQEWLKEVYPELNDPNFWDYKAKGIWYVQKEMFSVLVKVYSVNLWR